MKERALREQQNNNLQWSNTQQSFVSVFCWHLSIATPYNMIYKNGWMLISSIEQGSGMSNRAKTSGCTMPNDPIDFPLNKILACLPGKNSGSW